MYYAGTDALRTRRLLNALDEEVGALWAARDASLAPYATAARISYDIGTQGVVAASLRSKPRWLVGYSDLTALIALWNKAGVLALHGPMAANIQTFSEAARTATFDLLCGTTAVTQQLTGSIRYRGNGGARGKILGGNISVLASMVGSGLLPSYESVILFIGDLNEQAYNCKLSFAVQTVLIVCFLRCFILLISGVLLGFAVGRLLGADPASGEYTALALLDETWGPLGIPVLTGLPIGHDTAMAMLLVLCAQAGISFAEGSTVRVLKVEIPEVS
ncbi:hypothetical protein WG66_014101 [Moniliophthora roreri]|nr:hypothetical protein WG66_014101 [Moniliophthora roreri]